MTIWPSRRLEYAFVYWRGTTGTRVAMLGCDAERWPFNSGCLHRYLALGEEPHLAKCQLRLDGEVTPGFS